MEKHKLFTHGFGGEFSGGGGGRIENLRFGTAAGAESPRRETTEDRRDNVPTLKTRIRKQIGTRLLTGTHDQNVLSAFLVLT